MLIEDSGGASKVTYWDRATLEQHLISASSRGIGFGQGPPQQDVLRAEVRRLAAENDERQSTAVQQGYPALHRQQVSNTQLNNTNTQLAIKLRKQSKGSNRLLNRVAQNRTDC